MGRQAAIAAIGVALIYFGNSTLDGYLQGRLEMRRDEIASEEKREELATQKFLSEQETERMKILERAYYLKSRSVRQVHNRHLRPAG